MNNDDPNHALYELACQKIGHYDGWLKDFESRQRLLPFVQQGRQIARWEAGAFDGMPANAPPWPSTLASAYLQHLDHLKSTLPLTGTLEFGRSSMAVSGGATLGAAMYTQVSGLYHTESPAIAKWAKATGAAYEALESTKSRRAQVQRMLSQLKRVSEQEFVDCEASFDRYCAGAEQPEALGILMRNVLERVKGELLSRAQNALGRQKASWDGMANVLCTSPIGTFSHSLLLGQENVWESLQVDLTNLAKNSSTLSSSDVTALHTRLLDHIHAVCSLIGLQ